MFDVEVVEHEGQDGFAVLASCGDRDDAEHIAEALRAEFRRATEA
ncbi:hypothetical protein [Chelatococcus sambhunathii]|nr:hypothetical protein [Chelatococcus sambhunathii]